MQLERRVSHRRAMKRAQQLAMDNGALGFKITAGGRLNGAGYVVRVIKRVKSHCIRYGQILIMEPQKRTRLLELSALKCGSAMRQKNGSGRKTMPLMPKRVKYRKVQRKSRRGLAQSGNKPAYGGFGLQALAMAGCRLQIEACRVAANRKMKRKELVYSSLLDRSRRAVKCVWVRVKAASTSGLRWSSLEPCCLSWKGFGVCKECLR